jgi:Skp family chaperone for outer membrane proteins
VVNYDYIVTNSQWGKKLQKQLNDFSQKTKNLVEEERKKLEDIRTRISDGAHSLSEEKLRELKKSYDDGLINLKGLQDQRKKEKQRLRDSGEKDIRKKLAPLFSQLTKENNLLLLLSNKSDIVLGYRPSIDLTQEMMKIIKGRQH